MDKAYKKEKKEAMRDDTDWHMHYPRPGDVFVEHSNTLVVTDIDAGVSVVETIDRHSRERYYRTTDEFRAAYKRSTGEGYFVRYHGNNRREH